MSKRILVVEDQEDNRQILRDLLVSAGYEMTEAWTARPALALRKSSIPTLFSWTSSYRSWTVTKRHPPHQGRRFAALNPDHRSHVLCAQR